ncbi:MAG: hypothetical protein GOVbin2669_32 [Prokaryotic dsDNA virus sp.]|nr:MAG: hypothetical protein GOVbin2669_32 [Prokaryotic dsDNA virus sp.]|tara:strand:+ start:6025 stop:6552 length:528 start_codon:yes stop_codon:yes gene_type:complete
MNKKVKINKLKPNIANPRNIKNAKFKQLVQSIKDFPEMLEIRPIVVNSDMLILGGNMRHKAAIEAGLTEIPIKIANNITKEQEQEFIIKDNVGFGEWEWDLLANEWSSYELKDWGLDVWQNEDDIADIEEITTFSESVNFIIKCEDQKQLEELQSKLNTDTAKLDYDTFILKAAL